MSFDIHPQKKEIPRRFPPSRSPVYRERYSYPSFPVQKPSLPSSSRKRSGKKTIALILTIIGLGMIGAVSFPRIIAWKDRIVSDGEQGVAKLQSAVNDLKRSDIGASRENFLEAGKTFESAEVELRGLGALIESLRHIPGLSKPASGKNLLEAGAHIARAGEEFGGIAEIFLSVSPGQSQGTDRSMLNILFEIDPRVERATAELKEAEVALQSVRLSDVPEDKQATLEELRNKLPLAIAFLEAYQTTAPLFEELLGGSGPRKYLFLFQNNHELRPTGGFIGSYARLDMVNGSIRRFFIDGIFNPDGQLKENIVPPKPIQKISAGWSLHDSNWFPDFPASAEKAIFFYEKTGGPTVDGVITVTPTILGRLLEITGPIDLPDYGVTISSENFMTVVQEEVEVKYDREENQPKKILSDLTSAIFERLLLVPDMERFEQVVEAIVSGLNERHILLYSRHPETQSLIETAGWSGSILTSPHDYLSVIHTNINGYKTDGVIDEEIRHQSEVQSDGSIIDTVSITRAHRGGDTPYIWWNKVNADYMRVYVPLGSELISAEGMTREFPPAPLDYDTLGFRRDEDVEREEEGIAIDEESGTRVGVDAGKTVFGNWVYVSPKESVTVTYRYRLPMKLSLQKIDSGEPLSHSIIYQKQSGTSGVKYSGKMIFPEGFDPVWQTGKNLVRYGRTWQFEGVLDQNQFYGWVFAREDQGFFGKD